MKSITSIPIFCTQIATIATLLIPQLAQGQVPPIIDTTTPAAQPVTPSNPTTDALSKLEVKCQNLKTVVRKDEQQAVMMTWTTNYFGREFSNAKRCQIVSERLQKAADRNGGTFQGLELASGTINFQPVICALQNGSKKCDGENMLFTLKPENAANPEAVIEQILSFATDGSGSVDESARSRRSKVDFNLGNWERKAFANRKKAAPSNRQKIKIGGF